MTKKVEVMDGNTAAAYVSYGFTEVAGIFPITPSSPMAECVDEWAAKGKKNIFGDTVKVVEMQSEGGAAGAVHGSLGAGALTTTYTASQGLLLMVPNMYKIAGELLPGVFHVSARTLSAHGLSIFGDHSDVMACRQTGFALLASANPQEVMDLGAVAHLCAIRGRLPFLHFFDGFRTSHELQKIQTLDYDDLKELVDWDAIKAFRKRSLNPERPCTRGTTQNPDIFFQQREAANPYFNRLPGIVEGYLNQLGELTGRKYGLFDYYGALDARHVIVAMGSVCDTVKETVDFLVSQGKKVGLVNVHLYRPFSAWHFLSCLPKTVERIAVLDRTKEPGALGDPLYQDVCTVYFQKGIPMTVLAGRYGLASKDTTPGQILSVFENMEAKEPKDHFTVGIEDDVTFSSLPQKTDWSLPVEGVSSCKLWGLGSDGTVGANKNTIKIIGDTTEQYCQAYFVYDSKKSGGLTQSHLRFGNRPIRSPYLVQNADFVACHTPSYVTQYDMIRDLKEGGVFLLNCPWKGKELEDRLPNAMKRALAKKRIQFYTIDAVHIARELGLGGRTNTVLQAAFFKLVPIMDYELAALHMKDAIVKTYYTKKGQKVVDQNCMAVERGGKELVSVPIPAHWLELPDDEESDGFRPDFVRKVADVVNRQEGDSLPVSAFSSIADGSFPPGTTAYEKRGTAVEVPVWQPDLCIQCNQCAYVCPHAAIRPFLLTQKEEKQSPAGFETRKALGKGLESYRYRLQLSPLDCTGCESCVNVCPAKKKALVLAPLEQQMDQKPYWDFAAKEITEKRDAVSAASVKNSQFAQPLFEFSGACAGCAETPYVKLATQLFGDRMYIANASGCSTAFSGSTPSMPYTINAKGQGPAWGMSLFEDCAEYAFGMLFGAEEIQNRAVRYVEQLGKAGVEPALCRRYLEGRRDPVASKLAASELTNRLGAAALTGEQKEAAQFILENSEYLSKKSFWAFGGDGWAYDIGYGGVDHVLALGKDINMLVLDTEVYSNTGGQSSKSTAAGAVAKFASAGKRVKKKDLGLMAMSYGYVYVAQVAMGADQNQLLTAMREAEAYPGPSILIAYCPCIEHGPKCGMSQSQMEMKKAVEAGYWHLYRYDPRRREEGKNPFQLDSKEPTGDFQAFLKGENRYASLELAFPELAEELFEKAEQDAKERYETYRKMAEQNG